MGGDEDDVRVGLGRGEDDLLGRVARVEARSEGRDRLAWMRLLELGDRLDGELLNLREARPGEIGRLHLVGELHVRDVRLCDAREDDVAPGARRVLERSHRYEEAQLVEIDGCDDFRSGHVFVGVSVTRSALPLVWRASIGH